MTKKASKNKSSKKNLKLIIIGFFIVAVVAILSIKLFPTVRTIEVFIEDKDSSLTKEYVKTLSNIKKGDKLYKELRSQIEKRIEENPYIKSAKVDRDLSGKMTITVKERKPTYMINYAGEYIYIDEEGYILEVSTESNNNPIIIGLITDFSDLSIGNTKIRLEKEDLEKLEVVNNIFLALKSNGVENKITSVDITNRKNFILILEEENKTVYIGDGTDLNTRVLYMKKILQAESGNKGIIFIDNNLDEGYVYFKEQE